MTLAECARTAALLPALLLSGCLYVSASGVFGSALDPEVFTQIVPGETSKGQVLDLLGPPEEFVRSEVLAALGDETARLSGAVRLVAGSAVAFFWSKPAGSTSVSSPVSRSAAAR